MKKGAQVGFGNMGNGHFFSHREVKGSELAAVCDVRYDMAREKLTNFQIEMPLYSDMEEMIKTVRPDFVDIVTPTYTHADLAVRAMEMGCDVLCEKPMELYPEDAARMIEASKRTGQRLMIAHVVRFMAPYVYLKSVIDSGKFGKLLRLDMKRISSIPATSCDNWMQDFDKAGGVILDLSIHDIDFARYMFGDPKDFSGVYYTQKDKTEYSAVTLEYDGFSVSAEGGWYKTYIPFTCGFTAIFEGGMVVSAGDKLTENGNAVELTPELPMFDVGAPCGTLDGYTREIQYFVSRLESGEPFDAVSADSSLGTVALCRKIIDGAKKI
ncbi:MAG: Gfo/Idh/MocA family oxidoreductase [Clostridia bacterium]|nr:Gfo/Idh/MocA family oxidoreductase [Clostridia bacterium]